MGVRTGVIGTLSLAMTLVWSCGDDSASKPATPETTEPPALDGKPLPSSELMAPSYLQQSVRTRRKTHWFGMYLKGEDGKETKIGWMKLWMRPTVAGEPGAYAVGIEGNWNPGDGDTTSKGVRYYASEPPFRVIGLKLDHTGPDGDRKYAAVVEGKVMKLTSTLKGKTTTVDMPPTRETLGTVYAQMALDPLPLRTGMTGAYYQYDLSDRKDHEIVVTVEGVSLQASEEVGKQTVVDIVVNDNTERLKWRTRIAKGGIPIITQRGPVTVRLEDEPSATGAPAP